jgi:hypothetical protein
MIATVFGPVKLAFSKESIQFSDFGQAMPDPGFTWGCKCSASWLSGRHPSRIILN